MYLCGNGGSAANALHLANDWLSCGIKTQALTADVATLTALANDEGYDSVFARQIEVLGKPEELLIVLSGSGNSPNVLRAIEMASRKGLVTWAITGGGEALTLADHVIKTPANMQQSEERQLVIGHQVRTNLDH